MKRNETPAPRTGANSAGTNNPDSASADASRYDTRAKLLAFIHADPALAVLWERAAAAGGGDASHDGGHLLRVARWTVAFVDGAATDRDAIAAALMHDFVNVPKDSPDRARASQLSADATRPMLVEFGFAAESIDAICQAILDHSFSRGARPTEPLAMALQDADRLEALGAIGIMRCAATGQRMGATFFHELDPFATSRALDDYAFSVDHFFTKLLKLPDTMCTSAGRAEGRRRAETVRMFVRSLASELGEPCPPECSD